MVSRNVVLFLPPYAGKLLGPPLGLLSLAGSLREGGYNPIIIDGALDRNYEATIAGHIRDSLCFGVSLLTGPMIREAIEASRLVRRLQPGVPIIYGGWHPSLLSQQTLQEAYVDIVVRHQGEQTLIEVLQRIERGQSLDFVAGCWFKRNGRIHQNPDRPATPIRPRLGPRQNARGQVAPEGRNGWFGEMALGETTVEILIVSQFTFQRRRHPMAMFALFWQCGL